MVDKRLRLPTPQPSPRPFAQPERRLSNKVRAAIHTACDEGAVEIAALLLKQLDQIIHYPRLPPTGSDRRQPEHFTATAERLANLLLWRTQTEGHGSATKLGRSKERELYPRRQP